MKFFNINSYFYPAAAEEINYATYLGPFWSGDKKYDLGIFIRKCDVDGDPYYLISNATTTSNEAPFYDSSPLQDELMAFFGHGKQSTNPMIRNVILRAVDQGYLTLEMYDANKIVDGYDDEILSIPTTIL